MVGRRCGGVGGLDLLVLRDPEAFRSWKGRKQQGAPTLEVSRLLPQKLRTTW